MDIPSVVKVGEGVEMPEEVVIPKERHSTNIEKIGVSGVAEMEDDPDSDTLQDSLIREGGRPQIENSRSAGLHIQPRDLPNFQRKLRIRMVERDPSPTLGRNRGGGVSMEPETFEAAPKKVRNKRMTEGDPPPRLLEKNKGRGASPEQQTFEEASRPVYARMTERDPPPRLGKNSDGGSSSSCQDERIISIKEERTNWSGCSIFKIPKGLRDIDPDSYTPKIVSIGPVHRAEPHLKPMQEHKRRFLARMLARSPRIPEFYDSAISELADRARNCYSWRTESEISDQEFEQMLLLDACFIVELLLARDQHHVNLGYSEDDPIFAARGLLKWIQRDLLLLENQIPLFVVNRVFQITTCDPSVATLSLNFFQSAIPGYVKSPETHAAVSGEIKEEELHLLGFVRQCVVPSRWLAMRNREPKPKPDAKFYQVMPPSISTLKDSGVKLVRGDSRRLTEVDFDLEQGILYIPPLVIDDSFSTFLKNLMAFEQCYPHSHDEMSLYLTFLAALIDSPQDVAYLQHKGIIDNRLGSHEEVANLFNQACREIVTDRTLGSHLAELEKKLKQHLKKRCPRWRVSLNQEYFRHPWSIVSVIAAAILLVLTIMQVVYAMISYHLPP